jgi:hypothetical protein
MADVFNLWLSINDMQITQSNTNMLLQKLLYFPARFGSRDWNM